MNDSKQFAVVTGGSSGIGLELARKFAENNFDVLIAAEDDGVRSAAVQLAAGGASVQAVQVDLATPAGVDSLISAIKATGRDVDAIAINAGVGNSGAFIKVPLADEQRLLGLNVGSTVHIAKEVLPRMVARGSGRVLFTASIASTMPGPYYATYAASKAFVLSFAEALRYEVKDSGVTVTALMPGPTDTNFFERAGAQDTPVNDKPKDDPAEVAADGFEALMAGKDHVIAGSAKNKVQAVAGKFMSDPAKAAVHAKMTKPKSEE
jgi:short-subunit dehydrogenase